MSYLATEQFIKQARTLHGDKYDYSKVYYISSTEKVEIICPIHGEFFQKPRLHICKAKHGCPKCGNERISEKNSGTKTDLNWFLEKAKKIHGDEYDYSKVIYRGANSKMKVEIICKKHGSFFQIVQNHIWQGSDCPKCATILAQGRYSYKPKEFIDKVNIVHNNKYDYSQAIFVNDGSEKIKIICPKHGEFLQSAHAHMSGQGCPTCRSSKGETKVLKYLKENNIEFIIQHKFSDCKYKDCLRFDFYLPDHNICIEYDGSQHFPLKPGHNFWGKIANKESLKEIQLKDQIKNNYCKNNNIKLIRIPYTSFNNIEEILENKLSTIK